MIAVCMPIQKDVRPRTMQDLMVLRDFSQAAGVRVDLFLVEQEASHTARNLLTRAALETAATHLLWIDADMSFPRDALLRLLAHRLPIVSGLYWNRRAPFHPQLLRKQPAERAMDEVPMAFCYDWRRELGPDGSGSLLRVDATGAGFLLVERRVFTDIAADSKVDDGWWAPLGTGSDDIWFLRRATAAGYEIFVDTALELGHLGEVVVDAQFAARNRIRKTNNWSPPQTIREGRPLASIVIPTTGASSSFRDAAVRSAATQTVPVEVIVVGDAATELDPAALPPNARLCRADPAGPGGTPYLLNAGIREAQTDWIAWLAETDLMMPEKIEAQLVAADAAHVLALCHHYMMVAGDENRRVAPPPQWSSIPAQRLAMAAACWIHGSTTLIHKRVFAAVGPFDETLRFAFDWEMWNRIARTFFWHYLPESLGFRRELRPDAQSPRAQENEARRLWEDAEVRRRYADLPVL